MKVSPPPDESGGYRPGTVVNIDVVAKAGFTFSRWEREASGTSTHLVVTMTGNISIAAVFEERPRAKPEAMMAVCPPNVGAAPPAAAPAAPRSTSLPLALKVVGQVGGPTRAVSVEGNYAFVGVGHRLVALDISSPSAPRELGATEPMG